MWLAREKKTLFNGKCAAVVLAGGLGTRLGSTKPKGCFPVTPIKKKTLFQRLADRLKAASLTYQHPLEMAILTSGYHAADEFKDLANQVHFFDQPLQPTYDLEGNFVEMGPCGNGEVFAAFKQSPIALKWQRQGIEQLCVIPIDNPLADPFNLDFFAWHKEKDHDVSVIGIPQENPEEKTGVIVQKGETIEMVEYSEVGLHEVDGTIRNSGILCFSLDFFLQCADFDLPFHKALKMTKGKTVVRMERFIFDVLKWTKKSGFQLYPRDECFAPLKNLAGEDSIESVRSALLAFDKKNIFEDHGVPCSSRVPIRAKPPVLLSR